MLKLLEAILCYHIKLYCQIVLASCFQSSLMPNCEDLCAAPGSKAGNQVRYHDTNKRGSPQTFNLRPKS